MRLHHYIASLGRARRRALEVVLNDRVRQYQAHGKHPQIHGQRVELAVGNHLFSAAFSSLSLSLSLFLSPFPLLLRSSSSSSCVFTCAPPSSTNMTRSSFFPGTENPHFAPIGLFALFPASPRLSAPFPGRSSLLLPISLKRVFGEHPPTGCVVEKFSVRRKLCRFCSSVQVVLLQL